jgi:hypothetical protein
MNEALAAYFAGEKNAGAVLAVIGLAVGAGALFSARSESKAFAYTLAVWAALELAIGIGLYLKTDPQVAKLGALLVNDAAAFYAAEQPRMATVQRNFVLLEGAWLVLITGSAALSVWQKANLTAAGIALGMLINTSLLLTFDIAAERRGSAYIAALHGSRSAAIGGRAP